MPLEYIHNLDVKPVDVFVIGVTNKYLSVVVAIFDVINTDNLFKPMLDNGMILNIKPGFVTDVA